jgi:Holliday junction resolvase RusA-like endonuclease
MIAEKVYPTIKPDFDNIEKIVADSLLKLAFDDDKQIVESHTFKRYSERPRVDVTVEEIE